MSDPIALVLAAGKGTRMKSDLPKVLCPVLGRPMIHYVLDALEASGVREKIIVVGYQADKVRSELDGREGIRFVLQEEQLGTGHAVMVCRDELSDHDGPVLIVAGDSPMIQISSLTGLLDHFRKNRPACLLGTLNKENPRGLGRIVRDPQGNFVGIVEEKDATDEQRLITEVNMSTYIFDNQEMLGVLSKLKNQNSQGEYYITDCPALLLQEGKKVEALPVLKPCESLSINTLDELAIVEDAMRQMLDKK